MRVASVSAAMRNVVDDVKATAFMQPHNHGGGLIAVGNFGNSSATVRLTMSTRLHELGPKPAVAFTYIDLVADRIEAFQAPQTFGPGATITIPGKGGYLLRLVA